MNKREMDIREFGYVIGKVRDADHELNHALDNVGAYSLSDDQIQRVLKVLEQVTKTTESLEKVLRRDNSSSS